MIELRDNKENFYVLTHSIYELADAIATWAKKLHKHNTIETLRYIVEGDETEETDSNNSILEFYQ